MTETARPTLDPGILVSLRESVGGDVGFVRDLVDTYLSDGASQVSAIVAAAAAADADALVRPAHTLKSASYTLGAMRLGDLARALEMRGRGGILEGTAEEADATVREWAAAERALRAWVGTLP